MARGSGLPSAMGKQVPTRPGRLQAVQAPLQALLQQTPSVQWPEMQPRSLVQGWPFCALPQLSLEKSQTPPAWHIAALSHCS
jgi:hypothetical protein